MYHRVKKLMYTVNNGEPGPRFGRMLLEQFGVSIPRSKGRSPKRRPVHPEPGAETTSPVDSTPVGQFTNGGARKETTDMRDRLRKLESR